MVVLLCVISDERVSNINHGKDEIVDFSSNFPSLLAGITFDKLGLDNAMAIWFWLPCLDIGFNHWLIFEVSSLWLRYLFKFGWRRRLTMLEELMLIFAKSVIFFWRNVNSCQSLIQILSRCWCSYYELFCTKAMKYTSGKKKQCIFKIAV